MMGDIDALKHFTDVRVDSMVELGIIPLVFDTLQKQVQNQVFSCPGKKINPLYFNESDTRYESRFPLQDLKKATQMSGFFCLKFMCRGVSLRLGEPEDADNVGARSVGNPTLRHAQCVFLAGMVATWLNPSRKCSRSPSFN